MPPHRRRRSGRRQQQRRRDDADPRRAGERPRGHRVAGGAGRDRRRISDPRRDGAVGRAASRSGDDQQNAGGRLRGGDQRKNCPDPSRPPVKFPHRRVHRTAIRVGSGHPGEQIQHPCRRGPGLRRARGRRRDGPTSVPPPSPSRPPATLSLPASTSAASAATSSSAAPRPASSSDAAPSWTASARTR